MSPSTVFPKIFGLHSRCLLQAATYRNISVFSSLWLLLPLVLCLMACARVSQAQFSTFYSFSAARPLTNPSTNSDGIGPVGLIQAKDGNFYGTANSGGAYGYGTVFKITINGTLSTLYSFTGGMDGANPVAGLIQASDGNFYGTTSGGDFYVSTVFKITPAGVLTTLHYFGSVSAGLIQAKDGNLYGTAEDGGNGNGSVFKITTSGALTTIHYFNGSDGSQPVAGLIQASDGNLYGTTEEGGNGYGSVFKITTSGVLTTLHNFSADDANNTDGVNPVAGLIQASDGNLYGTTEEGGGNGFYGTVFKITTAGVLTTLHRFTLTEGIRPLAGLVQASDGNLYGTTGYGAGGFGDGAVFKITASGALTTLYNFSGTTDGYYPSVLIQAKDGNLYGTAGGGAHRTGTIYRLPLNASNGITDLRLNVPTLVTRSDGTRSLIQSVYAKGTGNVTFSGHWLDTSLPQANQDIQDVYMVVDFSKGPWQLLSKLQDPNVNVMQFPGHHLPLPGNHTFQFVLDTPRSSVAATSAEDVAITGFVPSIWGWHDVNGTFNYLGSLIPYRGLCEGFSQTARSRYLGLLPITDNDSTLTARQKFALWGRFQIAGNQWSEAIDGPRVVNSIQLFPGFGYLNDIYREASSMQARLLVGDPCVMDLYSVLLSDGSGVAHSVVATASFFSDSIYDNVNDKESQMRLFSIYDPNYPDDNDNYVGYFYTGQSQPNLLEFRPTHNYPYIMWNWNSYSGVDPGN